MSQRQRGRRTCMDPPSPQRRETRGMRWSWRACLDWRCCVTEMDADRQLRSSWMKLQQSTPWMNRLRHYWDLDVHLSNPYGMMSQPMRIRGVPCQIVNPNRRQMRVTFWPLKAPVVMPTWMNDQGSPPALLCFLFVNSVTLWTVLRCKCGVRSYVCVNSFCGCLLFCFGFLGSCFRFFSQGKSLWTVKLRIESVVIAESYGQSSSFWSVVLAFGYAQLCFKCYWKWKHWMTLCWDI